MKLCSSVPTGVGASETGRVGFPMGVEVSLLESFGGGAQVKDSSGLAACLQGDQALWSLEPFAPSP